MAPEWGSPEFEAQIEGWKEAVCGKRLGCSDLAKGLRRSRPLGRRGQGTRPVRWPASAPSPRSAALECTCSDPVLLEFASDDQKRRFLPDIANGRVNWCQGYSEPGAGSDLAGLQTRAVQDGDEYIINGSKIWTTSAHLADWIFCLVRTDPDAPKHEGISFILFDMKSPGVSVSPIRSDQR